eukprot:1160071-Pelagomonas_calceolata.AAC.19
MPSFLALCKVSLASSSLVVQANGDVGWEALVSERELQAAGFKFDESLSRVLPEDYERGDGTNVEPAAVSRSTMDATLAALFKGYPRAVDQMIRYSPPDAVLESGVYIRSPAEMPPSMGKGRVAILGEAAHPLRDAPSFFGGACQSMDFNHKYARVLSINWPIENERKVLQLLYPVRLWCVAAELSHLERAIRKKSNLVQEAPVAAITERSLLLLMDIIRQMAVECLLAIMLRQCVSFSKIDVGRVSSAYKGHIPRRKLQGHEVTGLSLSPEGQLGGFC